MIINTSVSKIGGGSPNLQNKTESYTPTETAQTDTITADVGYDGLGTVDVSVGAIPSNYIGSGVPQKSSADLTVSGDTVTAPSGYYSSFASASVASGSATTPATTINPSIFIGVQTNGQIDVTVSKTQSVTPTVVPGYVTSGIAGNITVSGSGSTQLATQGATTITPTESVQTAVASDIYTTGAITVDAIPSNYVGSGVTQRDSTDLSSTGAVVNVPSGYYANSETYTMPSGSATTPATTITANPSISVSASGLITSTASASQSVTPTVSAGYISSGTAGTVSVSGSKTQQLSTQGATTITPTESVQTAVASGKYTTGTVSVGAIPSNYVGSGVTQNDSTDLTASGATVTAPAGYYANNATYTIASGSATTPATTITPSVFIGVQTNGQIDVNVSKTQSVTPTVSAGYVSSGTAGNITVSGTVSSQLDTLGATTYTPTASDQTIADQQYLTGTQTIEGVVCSNLTASNIKAGVTVKVGTATDDDSVTSVLGTYTGTSPTGSTTITTNGSHDVTNYATAIVDVPATVDTKTSASQSSTTTSISISGLSAKPAMWALQIVINSGSYVSGASTRYITSALCSGGTTVYSTCLYKSGSTAREYGYSTCTWSYNNGTITITSPGTSTAGGFRTGSTYRLFYAY